MVVNVLQNKKPLKYFIKSIKKDYSLCGDDDCILEHTIYEVEIELLNWDDDEFRELTYNFVNRVIEKELNMRLKLFSIEGECFVRI